jgi:hypothetical protein
MFNTSQFFDFELQQERLAVDTLIADGVQGIISWKKPHKQDVLLVEDFSTGTFKTNRWTSMPNWVIDTVTGNPAQSAAFKWAPDLQNYSGTLSSKILTGLRSPLICLYYDIYLSNYSTSTIEKMAVECWEGEEWVSLKTYDNSVGSIAWTSEKLNIGNFISTDFQIRFHAYGDDSYSINNWNVDNVRIIANEPDFPVIEYWLYLDDDIIATTQDTSFTIPSYMLLYGQDYTVGVEVVYESGISERTEILLKSLFLPPPQNFVGQCIVNDAVLSWDLPDFQPISNPGALTGFSLFKNSLWLADLPAYSLTYIDTNLMQGYYYYEIIALYDLALLGLSGTGQSLPEEVEVFINDFGFELPFYENWDSASFSIHGWIAGGDAVANWKMNTMQGQPLPTVEFSWNPPSANYRSWLMSPPLNATPYECSEYFISFDLKLEDRLSTETEKLEIQVFYEENWIAIKRFSNESSFDWTNHTVQLPNLSGKTFYIKFVALGNQTAGIYRWLIDNIHIYNECRPPRNLDGRQFGGYQFKLTWDEPECRPFGGSLRKLSQWNGAPTNAYFQSYNQAYGVVYDLTPYPDAILEYIDFHHASWGILGTWQYKIHVVKWNTFQRIATIGPLSTTGNDKWENGVPLGQLIAYDIGQIGIMLEPLSNSSTDAYPCFSGDNSGISSTSLHGPIPNWSSFSASVVGNFMQNLWIRSHSPQKSEMIKLSPQAPAKPDDSIRVAMNPERVQETKQRSAIIPEVIVNQPITSLQEYAVYRKFYYAQDFEYVASVPVGTLTYFDVPPFFQFPGFEYFVTAVYDGCESIPSNIELVDFINKTESIDNKKLAVFPVPADKTLYVSCSNDIRKLQILNIFGQVVYERRIQEIGQTNINTSTLPPGIYVLRVYDEKGQAFSRKVIISR